MDHSNAKAAIGSFAGQPVSPPMLANDIGIVVERAYMVRKRANTIRDRIFGAQPEACATSANYQGTLEGVILDAARALADANDILVFVENRLG